MKKYFLTFLICAVFTSNGIIRADEGEKEVVSSKTLEEVVVTATKTEEKRKDIPNSVIVMDEIDISESPANSLGELLANELGIDWRTYGNYGGAAEEIHIRGMKASGTQIFINGVSINSPSLGVADVGRIPLNNIERIEVVKGSGSLLYGSGAMGGTINIITKGPKRDQMDLRLGAGYGRKDTYQVSLEQGMFVYGDLGYYLTANRRETDGFRDNGDLVHNDVSLKVLLDKGDALVASIYGDYIDREYGRPGVKPPETTPDYYINGVKFYSREAASLLDRGSDRDGHLVLQVKSNPVEWFALSLRGDYSYMENYNYSRYSTDGSGAKTWVINRVKGTEGNIEIRPLEGASLLLGAEYKDFDWERMGVDLDTSGVEIYGTGSNARAGLYTKAAFVEAQYRPFSFLKGLVGIRLEDHSEFGTEILPRYGIVLNPFDDTAIKVTHGRQFLAPTPNDLFWPWEDWGWGMGAEGNPSLRPETGWHTDVTIEQGLLQNRLFFTGSYFNWDMKNRILWSDDGTGIYRPTNLLGYEGSGCELGAKIGPFYNLALHLNYTYLDATEDAEEYSREVATAQTSWLNRRATYSPEHQFKGSLIYRAPFDFTASVTARYVGERLWYRNEGIWPNYKTVVYPLDPYWTFDFRLEQRIWDHWLVSLEGYNIFNEHYDTYLSTFSDAATGLTTVGGYPGAGRSIFFSVAYEF